LFQAILNAKLVGQIFSYTVGSDDKLEMWWKEAAMA
jgi:hypothetical protein